MITVNVEEGELVIRSKLIDSSGIHSEYGIPLQTQRDLRRHGNFPPAIQLGKRKLFWRRVDLESWLDSRIVRPRQAEATADQPQLTEVVCP